MNKTAIRNFAVGARRKLIEEISHKAYEIGITKDKILEVETFEGGFRVKGRENGQTFKKYELEQRDKLIQNIRYKGFDQVIEEVAYTWFNRFIALRFMEVNNYLPTGVRVLSSVEEGKVEPDIVKEALNIDLDIDSEIVYRLQDSNDTEDLYKYLLVKQCNQLGKIMPSVFEEIADYTEVLLPDKLLVDGSVIRNLVEEIEEYDWKIELDEKEKKEEAEKGDHGIEIIGWLYQYYISEKKDEVFAGLKNKKITKENIPAATQLFTPKWIVKYMIENSLGRLWLESHPNEELKGQWKYYLEEAKQEPEVQKQLDDLKDPNLNPEDIKVLDPAMGSGHILVYAFDLLYEIYLSAGYSEREIPSLILEKNLYGLDIDDRAGQLASFALLMKARSKNRRIFRNKPKMNLCSIQESNDIPKEAIEYFCNDTLTSSRLKKDMEYLIEVFHDAKEYGSILEVKEIDFDTLEKRIEEIRNNVSEDLFEHRHREIILEKIPPLIQQARIMSQKYDVVCTNPPYMGSKGMNKELSDFIKKNYFTSKNDLGTVFFEKCISFTKESKFSGLIIMHTWMFTSTYENFRKNIFPKICFESLVHLGSRAFEEISGEVVQTVAFTIRKNSADRNGTFIKLVDYNEAEKKEKEYFNTHNRYSANKKIFENLPGIPVSYWVSKRDINIISENPRLEDYAKSRPGLQTSDNDRFLRRWFEVNVDKIGFDLDRNVALQSLYKWFPHNKGGGYRKWYGNIEYVINFENDGEELKFWIENNPNDPTTKHWSRNLRNYDYYLLEGITWSSMGNLGFSARMNGKGYFFDISGPMIFGQHLDYICGFCNSKVFDKFNKIFSQTLSKSSDSVSKVPFILVNDRGIYNVINHLTLGNVSIAKIDWDSFETSWDFKRHPLLIHKNEADTIEGAFNNWSAFANQQFDQLKANEEELNRIFIDIYGLQDELTPDVDDKDVTVTRIYDSKEGIPESMKGNNYVLTSEDAIKSFISYAVGCMFGRYSLDEEGLIYAGGDFDDRFRRFNETWEIKTKDGWKQSSISIAEHNIIPIADGDYFEDDILERFVEFVKVSFGEETLEENLDYIAETLGKRVNETSRQAIRRYFLRDFYKDHVRIYKKRPIYWLFNSGRQNGFKVLVYMHRYDPFTLARVRTDYLHSLQKKYEGEINHLDILIDSEISNREKAAARRNKEKILKQIQECRLYDEALAHVANQRIEIDLDDGVKVNYEKFQGIKIPQGDGRKPLKADLLARI